MHTYEMKTTGRNIFLNLGKDELILESIQQAIQLHGIRNGVVVSGIGAVKRVRYHRITTLDDRSTNQYVTVDGPIEVTSIQGLIVDGEPHLHISCCDQEHAFGGHLENGSVVQYLAEISILECEGMELTRRPNEFDINYIEQK